MELKQTFKHRVCPSKTTSCLVWSTKDTGFHSCCFAFFRQKVEKGDLKQKRRPKFTEGSPRVPEPSLKGNPFGNSAHWNEWGPHLSWNGNTEHPNVHVNVIMTQHNQICNKRVKYVQKPEVISNYQTKVHEYKLNFTQTTLNTDWRHTGLARI